MEKFTKAESSILAQFLERTRQTLPVFTNMKPSEVGCRLRVSLVSRKCHASCSHTLAPRCTSVSLSLTSSRIFIHKRVIPVHYQATRLNSFALR